MPDVDRAAFGAAFSHRPTDVRHTVVDGPHLRVPVAGRSLMCAGACGGSLLACTPPRTSRPANSTPARATASTFACCGTPGDDSLHVSVADARTDELFFLISVASQHALEAFHHPFAYAAPALDAMPVGGC
jgi:hypothetical protein